jgi:hypothetical protein
MAIPHPVLVQAGFGLEPLAGEAQVDGGAGGGAHATERQVGCGPDLDAGCVGAEDRAADLVGADEGGDATFDHGEGGRLGRSNTRITIAISLIEICVCRNLYLIFISWAVLFAPGSSARHPCKTQAFPSLIGRVLQKKDVGFTHPTAR